MAAIRDEYRKETSEEGDTLSALTVTRAVHSGNLAYITGTYTGTGPKPGGGMQTGSGHFVSVMKRVRGPAIRSGSGGRNCSNASAESILMCSFGTPVFSHLCPEAFARRKRAAESAGAS